MHYKERNKSLSKNNKKLKKKNKKLKKDLRKRKKELKLAESKANMTLREKYDNDYERFSYFCDKGQMDFYFDENFEDKLKEVTKNLDSKEKYFYKYLFLRSLFVNFIRKDTFYTEEELEIQKEFTEFRKNNIEGNNIAGFKFSGGYNLHPFIGFSLDETSLDYLKDKDIIDAGAFTGDTSLPLSKLTNANVYAFEPFDESYELLNKNINDNDIKNIVPVKKSLGNIDGTRSLYLAGQNVQGITSDADFREYDVELKVDEAKIDTFVKENNLNVGFIIVDVEGAELDLLEGAKNTIITQKPILTISIYHRMKDFAEIIPWIANLDLGYEFKILRESPWSLLSDTSVLCIPKEFKK
ncbi:MAG: FkbM family methyltransferase [Methanobrevibacter sp.]|nr:FkbM family methyltransferase [Methanobrevibacter sp.]